PAAAAPDTGRAGQPEPPPIGRMADALESDVEKSTFLVNSAAQQAGEYGQIIAAAEKISSDNERARVLEVVARRPGLGRDDAVALLRATGSMSSDGSKRWVLASAAPRLNLRDEAVRRAFFAAVNTFSSDGERRHVLLTAFEHARPDAVMVREIILAAGGMSSDGEKRHVLTTVAERHPIAGALRDAYLQVVEGMDSDGERSYTLSVLLEGPKRTETGSAAARPTRQERTAVTAESIWNGTHETNSGQRYVRLVAKDVVTGRTQAEVRSLRPGGSLVLEERAGGDHRLLRGVPAAGGGGVAWTYQVNGQARPFDAAARSWMQSLIREATEPK
ncbi:MAG TPA: hypothetical protein VFX98_08460, partial [Longimicrobiaceae bacterium]|nr:hypothetical protein [Longimicrobiaceae bacterium]